MQVRQSVKKSPKISQQLLFVMSHGSKLEAVYTHCQKNEKKSIFRYSGFGNNEGLFIKVRQLNCNHFDLNTHNTDFAKTNQNEVVRIRTNFFEDFRIRKLIRENEFVILNL